MIETTTTSSIVLPCLTVYASMNSRSRMVYYSISKSLVCPEFDIIMMELAFCESLNVIIYLIQ